MAPLPVSERLYPGERDRKLTGWPLLFSSLALATTETILLSCPLQLLKLRHMNTRSYIPFRHILYDCLFAKPPTVVRGSCVC